MSITIVQPLPDDTEAAPLSAERARPTETVHRSTAESANPGEAVNVCVQRGAVTIVVRDAALTDDEALRCAFETARTLTGEHAALSELTLNGRILYRHSLPADSATSPTLVFAC